MKIIILVKNFYKSWISIIKLNNINYEKYKIVFYVEDCSDWIHLEGIIQYLDHKKYNLIKLTSDIKDEKLLEQNIYYVGTGSARTYLFKTLKFKCMVLTMTDLNTFYLKRSIHKVHYYYVFHSIISTHRAYRERAFNNYDTLFCVGEHHIKEIRKTEQIYNLNKKNLVKFGYNKLDVLIKKFNDDIESQFHDQIDKHKVLIAPTWGKGSIDEKLLFQIIDVLISNEFKVSLRLHPMTTRNFPNLKSKLANKFIHNKNIFYESNLNSVESYFTSDIMISDWSGAAIEFSLSTKKPVIFIDTDPKINNKNWEKIDLKCLEEEIRNQIGEVVNPNQIKNLPYIVKRLTENNHSNINFLEILKRNIFNVGKSSDIGGKHIINFISKNL